MANTFTLIASSTVGSGGATTIDFTSIAATWTDLVLKFSFRTPNGGANYDRCDLQFNGDTGNNYSNRLLYGTGSSAGSDNSSASNSIRFFYANAGASTSSTFSNGEIYIPNYAGSTQKSASMDSVTENNATAAIAALNAGLWTGTSAITSIKIFDNSSTFSQYSTAYLYGVKNA